MADHIEMFKEIKKVAGFLRISTEKTDYQGKKITAEETLKNHTETMTTFFKQWGIELVLYSEVLSGGSDFEDRKALQDVLKDLKDEKMNFDAMAIIELERLSRDSYVSGIIKKALEDSGAKLIVLEPFQILDMNNSSDSLMFMFASAIAEHNRKIASNRVKLNKLAMARQGLNSSGSVPYGYIRNPQTKKLEIETIETVDENGNKIRIESDKPKIVRQIFQWHIEGMGQRSICDKLNEMGIPNKQGNKWVPQSLKYLLTCETYIGTLTAKSNQKIKGKLVPAEIVTIENNHPPIIDDETWEKSQRLRNAKRDRSGVDQRSNDWNSKKNTSILDGLIYCGCDSCNRKSTIKWYSDKKKFYIIKCTRFDSQGGKDCNNGGIAVGDVEQVIFQKILEYKQEVEKRISSFESNDFASRNTELQEMKEMLEKQMNGLKVSARSIRQQEMAFYKKRDETGIVDEFELEMIEDDKNINHAKRMSVQQKIDEITLKLSQVPNVKCEVKQFNKKLDIIKELENRKDLTNRQVNSLLKQIILKVNYKRILPDNYVKLSFKEREKHQAELEIEYLD
jgi:site-specific DNA recombinase